MDQRADDDIQQGIEETRQEIEETRLSMTEKLEMLEERVRETVEGAKSTVEDIMENVKGTVDDTVETVKQTVEGAKSTVEGIVENVKGTVDDTVSRVKYTFDLNYQMDQRPWLMFGGSVLAGYLLGCLGRPSSTVTGASYSEQPTYGTAYYSKPESSASPGEEVAHYPYAYSQPQQRGMWSNTFAQFKEEFDIIKGAAIGALMSTLRDMVKQSMPNLAPQIERAIDSATTKLGGQPADTHTEQQGAAAADKPAANPPAAYGSQQAGPGRPLAV